MTTKATINQKTVGDLATELEFLLATKRAERECEKALATKRGRRNRKAKAPRFAPIVVDRTQGKNLRKGSPGFEEQQREYAAGHERRWGKSVRAGASTGKGASYSTKVLRAPAGVKRLR